MTQAAYTASPPSPLTEFGRWLSGYVKLDGWRKEAALILLCSLSINLLSLALPIMSLQVYDRILIAKNNGTLWMLSFGVCVAVLLELVLRVARSYIIGWAGAAYEQIASEHIIYYLTHIDLRRALKKHAGSFVQQFSLIAKLKELYSGQTLTILIDLPFVVIYLGLIAYLARSVVWVPILLLAVFCLLAWLMRGQLRQSLVTHNDSDESRYGFLIEALQGLHTIKGLGLEPLFERRFEALQAKEGSASYQLAEVGGMTANMGNLFGQLMLLAVIVAGAPLVVEGRLHMGALIASLLMAGRIMQPVQRIVSVWMRMQDINIAEQRMKELLEAPLAEQLEGASESEGRLECHSVSLMAQAGKHTLHAVNLAIAPGECVAIRGEDMHSINVLVELLAGFYAPDSGNIIVDGVEVSRYSSGELVRHVAYIPPEATLFQGTILDNITQFYKPNEQAAYEIAESLGIDQAVAKLPLGYGTPVGDQSAEPLPTGLRQRISMARALVHKPRLILFDQAERGLDKDGYQHILKAITHLKGKTSLVLITADENFLRLADKIYILNEGELYEGNKTISWQETQT